MTCAECKEIFYPYSPEVARYDPRTLSYDPPVCQHCPNRQDDKRNTEERLGFLEEITAVDGSIPPRYEAELKQVKGLFRYLDMKMDNHLQKSTKRVDRL